MAPQTLQQLQTRLNAKIVLFHSAMSDNDRAQAWLASQAGLVDVVIGTRSAIFTPLPDLGLILIDEEHDLSFKQQDGLRYHTRDAALLRCQKLDIPIVLGSATPSLETLQNINQQRFQQLSLKQRAGEAKPPQWELLDIRKLKLDQGLSKPLLSKIAQHLSQGEQVLIFLNRRGYAPSLICYDCGWLAQCRHCDARYTLHKFPNRLICHHCDTKQPLPTHCPECQSPELHPLGIGTERLQEKLEQHFQDVPVIRMDRDVVRKKGELDAKLQQIHTGDRAILLGTQMLAKGHHFPNVTLVAVIDIDAMLFSSDFRAMERGAQLLVQVGGRAGRVQKKGSVILQTFHPDHPMLQLLLTQGYVALSQALLKERSLMQLPPFAFLVLLRAESPIQQQVEHMLAELHRLFAHQNPEVSLMGPIPALMLRKQGRFRFQLLLQSQRRSALHKAAAQIRLYLSSKNGRKLARNVRWALDVDPQEMV
ncbi:MAG: primosomal protein N' [Gammaproteobacteria bacterium CG22_combo_CG10-13_8_21_14_all_40_8]|nr:MAG: primosomal protein N' [Gammaproteobacteria bacterium CG22_combo_CG10-13_8_21_14_all_40_8]